MRRKSVCTINTDAGYYPREKIGSFAYWIKADGLHLKDSGILKGVVKNPLEAEMKAIINALFILDRSNYTGIAKLIINRDNISAKSSKSSQNELERKLALQISTLRKKCGYRGLKPFFEFRHVKAHSGKGDPRSWVNEWCDEQCKTELRNHKQRMVERTERSIN